MPNWIFLLRQIIFHQEETSILKEHWLFFLNYINNKRNYEKISISSQLLYHQSLFPSFWSCLHPGYSWNHWRRFKKFWISFWLRSLALEISFSFFFFLIGVGSKEWTENLLFIGFSIYCFHKLLIFFWKIFAAPNLTKFSLHHIKSAPNISNLLCAKLNPCQNFST